MNPFTIQTVFLLYSGLSFLSAILIGALFWKKKDFSANLWLCGCLLTSIATAVTVYRAEIALIISFSLMVSFETLSILLFGESLKVLGKSNKNTELSKIAFIVPAALFTLVEIEGSTSNGMVTPAMSATATFVFGIGNLFCLYQAIRSGKEFTNQFFFNFLATAFGLMSCLYFLRVTNAVIGYSGYTFDIKTFNVIIWFLLALFGSIRNLAYIVLRLHLGFAEHSHLNNMNLKLSNILDERNEMILSLERLNKSAAINALASTIAHEINQPLGAARLNAQFAEIKLNSEPTNTSLFKEVINNILYDINRAAKIVENLGRLKSSKASATPAINLLDSIHEVAEISKSKLNNLRIDIQISCSPEILIKINLSEWQQTLINLINNAIEALSEIDGAQRKITISVEKKNDQAEIAVQDNGPGILNGQESKIFDLMVTNKEAGTGIGLWLSKNILNRNGGDIFARNLPNGGACFIITIPSP